MSWRGIAAAAVAGMSLDGHCGSVPTQEQVDTALDAATNTLFAAAWTPTNVPYASVRRTAALALANALDMINRPLADAMRDEARGVGS